MKNHYLYSTSTHVREIPTELIRVRDHFSGDLYARGQQIIALEDKTTAPAEKHLEDETDRLRDLRHRHVVQLVKFYQCGKMYGILLEPAALTCENNWTGSMKTSSAA